MNPIQPIFSTPIAAFQIPKLESLNKELMDYILASEKGSKANLKPSQKIQPEVFESNFKFLDWDSACCRSLKEICVSGLKRTILETNNISERDLNNKELHMDSWFHITRRGGYVQPHNHPNASWSFVYCVADGEKDAEHLDSGALIFHSPQTSCNMFQDGSNSSFKAPYSQNSQKFVLRPGMLLIFPSHLVHSVSPYFGDTERVTVAANVWFTS